MTRTKLEKDTREVFHSIHSGHLENTQALERIRKLLSTENMGLEDNYFEGKVCADLGCGSAISGTYNLLELGAKKVHSMDLTDSIIEPAKKVLDSVPGFRERCELHIGSLEDLPFEDEQFDFVLCQGVIHHLDDDKKAMSEICRTLKPGGMANIMVHGSGGLMTRFVMEVLRDEYQKNEAFKTYFDTALSVDDVHDSFAWLKERVDDDGSENYAKCMSLLDVMESLLDKDALLTVRDRVQAPMYRMYTEEQLKGMLSDAGFSSSYRVTRKPKFGNVRTLLAPLYHEYDHPLARLIYGEGMITLMATK